MPSRVAVLMLAVLSMGCVEKASIPTVPEQILSMQLSALPRDLPRGQTMTLTVSLTNVLEEAVQLVFPTTCQVKLYIRDGANRLASPKSDYSCATVPSQIELQPAEITTFTFTWSGESELGGPGSGTPLEAGSYYASAEMLADGYTGFAFPISIVLLN
jgi:hypothetical protein